MLYHRYQVPPRMPMTKRLAKRLVMPESGVAVVVQSGLDVVGHGVIERGETAANGDGGCHRGLSQAGSTQAVPPGVRTSTCSAATCSRSSVSTTWNVGWPTSSSSAVASSAIAARAASRP